MNQFIRQQQPGRRLSATRVAAVALVVGHLAVPTTGFAQGARWVGTWATVPVARNPEGGSPAGQAPAAPAQAPQIRNAQGRLLPAALAPQPILPLNNQTLRQIVRVSIGGDRVRVVLSNVFGVKPLSVGAARVALRDFESTILPNSSRPLTFSGRTAMTIPAGAILVSDPVTLTVPSMADLAIDMYLPEDLSSPTSPMTVHAGTGGLQSNYVSLTGDHTGAVDFPIMTTTLSWYFLARVEVTAPDGVGALVAFGDSITDGSRSTANTNNRWPDHLARRLASQNIKMAVLNAGFSGNRVLTDGNSVSGLGRFDRDVLALPGVTHVVVMLGINDIGQAGKTTAADLIAGHGQFVARAHALGIKIYASTLSPFEGAAYWTPEGEAKRQALNDWIRTSKVYDGVIDFDAVLRDPKNPTKFLPRFNSSGDNLHPGDAGYRAMANAFDLALVKAGARPTAGTR